ncbi:hypothetical protein J4734_21065 [Klebsiella pneumoniae]|uniref:Uncharacterized protein n=1 Tax=Klebsiella pneumoniae TaxID=573 RepID=A0A939NS73_KLEPN|nr:hypothetical protein [Klebsiella pneumoniae]
MRYVNAGQIQSSFEEEEPSKFLLERLSKRWQQVHEADTDSKPRLRLIENRFEELVRKAEFTLRLMKKVRSVICPELSDGQRSCSISLLQRQRSKPSGKLSLPADDSSFEQDKLRRIHLTILAIEEPENSLSTFFYLASSSRRERLAHCLPLRFCYLAIPSYPEPDRAGGSEIFVWTGALALIDPRTDSA